MSKRLIITMTANRGKGDELVEIYRERCRDAMQEPGCEQFEVFRSIINPDRLVICERWRDEEIFAAHMKRIENRPPLPKGLRTGDSEREDYVYNRTC